MRVLFLSSGLGVGGAEMALLQLVPHLETLGITCAVASLRELGPVGERMRAAGIRVHALGMPPGRPTAAGLWRLWRLVRAFRPDVLHGWMYHGNVAAHIGRLVAPRVRVFGAIHQTLARTDLDPLATRLVIRLDAWLSHWSAGTIYVAQSALAQHIAHGYAARAAHCLPNGVDTQRFAPDSLARERLRAELGFTPDDFVIGTVGRHHPVKDHAGFLRAAIRVLETHPQAAFVMAGDGLLADNPSLAALASHPLLAGRLRLLGLRSDVAQLMTAFDAFALSSLSEGLPNVVAEAMGCGLPCVVTDVGDVAWMVGESGWVVAPGDPLRLAAGFVEALSCDPGQLAQRGRLARQRALACFEVSALAEKHARLLAP